jgi:hypothetical protein
MSTVSWLRQLFIVSSSPGGNPGESLEIQCSQPECSKRYLLKRDWSENRVHEHWLRKLVGLDELPSEWVENPPPPASTTLPPSSTADDNDVRCAMTFRCFGGLLRDRTKQVHGHHGCGKPALSVQRASVQRYDRSGRRGVWAADVGGPVPLRAAPICGIRATGGRCWMS